MTPGERARLESARRDLPRLAVHHGSKQAVTAAFRDLYPDVVANLGDMLLGRWCWEQLRAIKDEHGPDEGEKLPLFGAFRDEIAPRPEWEPVHYLAYLRRYQSMAVHGRAKTDLLAAEFVEKFGMSPGEWQQRDEVSA
jgi:hypothetical protein